MTSRERMLAAMACEPVDRVPCSFMIFSALNDRCHGPEAFHDWQREAELDPVVNLREWKWGRPGAQADLPGVPVEVGDDVEVRHFRERAQDGPHEVLCKEVSTPEGALTAEVNLTADWADLEQVPLFDDWLVPRSRKFLVETRDDLRLLPYILRPPSAQAAPAELRIETATAAGVGQLAEYPIDQPHIPETTVFVPARVKAVPVALATGGKHIGYIAGAGDDVAARLAQVGYQVTELAVDDLAKANLSGFDAIVTGVRAFNVFPRLMQVRQRLFDYVAKGGTMLVQYNTNGRWRKLAHPLGPAPFVIDRGRVTDETAPLRALDANHPVLTTPNRLTAADYQGWVQERGLYFAKTWSSAYTPIFAANDPDDPIEKGAVLVMAHGKGGFVYTGLSFFRQLPAGVPGAYRLFANLLAWRGQ